MQISHDEFKSLLPCFFDIKLRCVSEITNITMTTLFRLRSFNKKTCRWPFNTVKDGMHPKINWRVIRDLRGRAILDASPEMRAVLFKVELRACQMRANYLVRSQREAIEAETFFPPFPPSLTQDPVPIPQPPPVVDGFAHIPLPQDGCVRFIRPSKFLSREEINIAVENMIDIPIYTVTVILRLSVHTLNGSRSELGFKVWPYESIRRGDYPRTRAEITKKREEVIKTLPRDSILHMVLSMAAEKSSALLTKTDEELVDIHEDSTLEHACDKEECAAELSMEELRDWFGLLIESPQPPPEPEDWVKEGLKEAVSGWQDDGDTRPPCIWDDFVSISPRTQAYWDSLADLEPGDLG